MTTVKQGEHTYEIEYMSYDELTLLKIELINEISLIKVDINKAIVNRKEVPIDKTWMYSAERARIIKDKFVQQINYLMGKMKRDKQNDLNSKFVQISKDDLGYDKWRSIMDKAQKAEEK